MLYEYNAMALLKRFSSVPQFFFSDLLLLPVQGEVMGAFWDLWIQGLHSNRLWELKGLLKVSMVTDVTVVLRQSAVWEEDDLSSTLCCSQTVILLYLNKLVYHI